MDVSSDVSVPALCAACFYDRKKKEKSPILCAAFWKINQTWRWWRHFFFFFLRLFVCKPEKHHRPSCCEQRVSRECTASVRRRHGELGVLIKIFYKPACALHMQDNGLEQGGVRRILKQLPTLKQTPELTRRSTRWRNVCHFTLTFKDSRAGCPRLREIIRLVHSWVLGGHIYILGMKRAKRKQFDIVTERQ